MRITPWFLLCAFLSIGLLDVCVVPSARADAGGGTFLNLARPPDEASVTTEEGTVSLQRAGASFQGGGATLETAVQHDGLAITLAATKIPVKYLKLRWSGKLPAAWKYLGDAWERAYGELQWRPLAPPRTMPWYFLASNGSITHGYGVMTDPAAICGWQADAKGVTLVLDVRNGGRGVLLGRRRLAVCTVVCRRGKRGESPFAAAHEFCRRMCPHPRLPKQPVYGFNDWYCDYGKSSAQSVRYYADYVVRLAPKGVNRPFMVIDDGWQVRAGNGGGTDWDRGNDKFPSMPDLAADIEKAGARPGIWVRLLMAGRQPSAWRLQRDHAFLDPSRPEVRDCVKARVGLIRSWGFQLLKHDFSTFDLMGVWRTAAAAENATWCFHDRSRTTAEIIRDFYLSIREAAGDEMLILGCQTVGHLAAGIFEISRIGDDTSGKDWARVRTMGVNSLAFRAAQHGAFFAADADCVGLTEPEKIPWTLNRQWLNLVARSGTPLFISFKRGALTAQQEEEVKAALDVAAAPQPLGEPLDWFDTRQARKWRLMDENVNFQW